MDAVLPYVGSCGCFQITHVMCVDIIRSLQAWSLYLMVFGNYEPPWECVRHRINSTSLSVPRGHAAVAVASSDAALHPHPPAARDSLSLSSSIISSPNTNSKSANHNDNDTDLRFRQGTCDQLPLCDKVKFDPTSVTLVTDFELICDRSFIPNLIIAVQMSGMVVGAYLGGQMGESFGRKIGIYSHLGLLSVACSVAAWSVSWHMYACLSFFIGVGGGGIATVSLVYSMEFLTPKWRGRIAMFPTWYMAMFTHALLVMALKNWHHIHMVTGALSGLQMLFGVMFSQESLRWLQVRGKDSRAKKVLAKMMKYNSKKELSVDEVFKIYKDNNQYVNTVRRSYTALSLLRNRKLRVLTLKSASVGFLLIMTYYTLGFSVKALSGDYYINLLISSAVELPFLALVILCMNRFGRKFTLYCLSGLGTLFTMGCVIAYYVTTYDVSGPIMAYLGIFAKGFAGVGWITYTIYNPELFPTPVRSVALGFVYTVARIGTVLGAMFIPRDPASLAVCFIILCVGMFIAGLVIFTLPETKGRPLEDDVDNVKEGRIGQTSLDES